MEIKSISLRKEESDIRDQNTPMVNIDFKVVSFNLGDKSYVIDIMKVKEIRKSSGFTYIPNTKDYVVGLDNLRGDVIPIVDLRIMFNIRFDKKETEDILVIRNEESLIGIIVDKVNTIFGINLETIQTPHPFLFQGLLIKYIKGVIDYNQKLYILLDISKIFNYNENYDCVVEDLIEDEKIFKVMDSVVNSEQDSQNLVNGVVKLENFSFENSSIELQSNFEGEKADTKNFNLKDIKEKLLYYSFNANLVKDSFLERIKGECNFLDFDQDEYNKFLNSFYSKYSRALWNENYLKEFHSKIIDKYMKDFHTTLKILNINCGDGKETLAIATIFYEGYVKPYKIFALDSDLLKVVETANLTFSKEELSLSKLYEKNSFEQKQGIYKFNPDIMKKVLFEYSDALLVEFPDNLGLVFLRDILSFLSSESQSLLFKSLHNSTVIGSILILGDNEELINCSSWRKEESIDYFNVYKRV